MALAEKLGSLVGQLSHGAVTGIAIEAEGAAAALNLKPITGAVLAGFMRVHSDTVNMVNAPFLARSVASTCAKCVMTARAITTPWSASR